MTQSSTAPNDRVIIFFADRHFGSYVGKVQAEILSEFSQVIYIEEDYGQLIKALGEHPESILALNAITETPGNETLPAEAEAPIKAHLERGNDLWVMHGASAALWPWKWWRDLMKIRWVRNNDPDGAEPSWHPVEPYTLTVTEQGTTAVPSLKTLEVPKDELYVALAEEPGAEVWMTATYDGQVWPQVYSFSNPWNGTVCGWIPGHDPEVMKNALGPTFATVAKAWLG